MDDEGEANLQHSGGTALNAYTHNANGVPVVFMEVEVALEQEHIDYLIAQGFLAEEDAEDQIAIGQAVGAWLDSLSIKRGN